MHRACIALRGTSHTVHAQDCEQLRTELKATREKLKRYEDSESAPAAGSPAADEEWEDVGLNDSRRGRSSSPALAIDPDLDNVEARLVDPVNEALTEEVVELRDKLAAEKVSGCHRSKHKWWDGG